MADHTKIEWCDATLNCWWGCTKVSDGCKFCYAEHLADDRYKKGNWGPNGVRQEVKSWRSTLNKISKRAKAENRRLRVFCQSMSDTFEGPETMGGINSENWNTVGGLQTELLIAIQRHPELDFLVLTKRPENVVEMITDHNRACLECGRPEFTYPSNFWIGTSVEDQKTADERIPHLLKVRAAVRFLSCEPLLGPVCLRQWIDPYEDYPRYQNGEFLGYSDFVNPNYIHWVICGGESGPNARPMHPDWPSDLRHQCQAAGVPFFFKQWGAYVPVAGCGGGITLGSHERIVRYNDRDDRTPWLMHLVGKKAAGRLLDGREWNEFPEVANG